MAKLGNHAMRNLSSAGMSAANFTRNAASKAAVGVFKQRFPISPKS